METIIKDSTEMAEILGITKRAVTARLLRIRIRASDLNNSVQDRKISRNDAHRILSELKKERLAGYDYEVKGTGDRKTYVFYKNV